MQFLNWFKKPKKTSEDLTSLDKQLNVILDEKSIGFNDNLSDDEVAEIFLGFFTGVYLDGLHQYIVIKHPGAVEKIKLAISAMSSLKSIQSEKKVKNKTKPLIEPLMNFKQHE